MRGIKEKRREKSSLEDVIFPHSFNAALKTSVILIPIPLLGSIISFST